MNDPQSTGARPQLPHWLEDLATFSGVPDLKLPPDPGPDELARAWETVGASARLAPAELAERIAGHFHLQVADLDRRTPVPTKLVPMDVARRYCVFPLEASHNRLYVATSDPPNPAAREALESLAGREVTFRVATPGQIMDAISRHYAPERYVESMVGNILDEVRPDGLHVRHPEAAACPADIELDAPAVVKLTGLILDQLARPDVAEVHVEPETDGGRVRVRHEEGSARHFMHLPLPALTRVVFRLKKLAGLDLAQRDRPQKGSIQATVRGEPQSLFVATTPGLNGERLSILTREPDYAYFLEEMQQTLVLAQADPSRGRVLVVDDDPSARLLIRSVLEKLGFQVLEAEDGPPALETLESGEGISLVMLDLNMPRQGGREVLGRIRSTVGTTGLPVVVLTGVEDPEVEIELLGAGADDFLRKPIDPQLLAVRVQAVLRRAGAYEPWLGK